MPPLAETQRRLRAAVVDGDGAAAAGMLAGGSDPLKRLAIHARHYEASLATALADKFPALVWLAGAGFVREAARAFVRAHPPTAPCIAEYGEQFPDFLAQRARPGGLPYLTWAGALEWRLGQTAIAIEQPPVAIGALNGLDGNAVAGASLRVQPGLRYLAAPYAVDELLQLFLSEVAPERYALAETEIWLEIHGARGRFGMRRLDRATFLFRAAVARGATVGAALAPAIEADPAFDPGAALVGLFADGHVTAVVMRAQEALS